LIIKNNICNGVICNKNKEILSKKVILTTGTYMNAITHIGQNNKQSGPDNFEPSNNLSNYLKTIGFELLRLKTGTPPRVEINSIKFNLIEKEYGTNEKLAFSHFYKKYLPFKKQMVCYLTYTNQNTHKIIKNNLKYSALYSGNIKGTGPRYCPSIEDKIVRFSEKPRHQIFIEPESKSLNTMYLQGLSSSLPKEIQDQFIHSIKGLEKAKIIKYAYAIEYDAINP
jgi:tRNA uridine 5-carboxymethylaminomethyl modification enzyme